jgi:hypothetical protein
MFGLGLKWLSQFCCSAFQRGFAVLPGTMTAIRYSSSVIFFHAMSLLQRAFFDVAAV